MAKKILKFSGLVIGIVVVLALVLPFVFKDKIVTLVKKEVNNSLNAEVDFRSASLSFFKHFPRVSLSLQNLYIAGVGQFSGDTLVKANEIDVAVNLWSVITGSTMEIHSVSLNAPSIHAIVRKDGSANWDIVKPDSSTSESTDSSGAFHVALQKYSIKNGTIRYDDEQANMHALVTDLQHTGKGDFTQDLFTLTTETNAGSVSFSYEGVPYLSSVKAVINTDLEIDAANSLFRFDTDKVLVNDLLLNTRGSFQLPNDSTYRMDISFKTPENSFKSLLSLIPAIYAKDFEKIKTSGFAEFEGAVKGDYNSHQIPAFKLEMKVRDGFFQYTDLPKPVKNIQLNALVENPDGLLDNTVVNVSLGHIEFDDDPFDFRLTFTNPETKKYIDAVAKGKLDLGKLTQLVKLDEGTKLAGIIDADIFAKGNMSALENQSGPFSAGGFLDIAGLYYASKDVPQPIKNGNARVNISNTGGIADQTTIDIPAGHIEFGNDPIDFSAKISRPMSDLVFDAAAKGTFNLENVKHFTDLEPGTSVAGIIMGDIRAAGSNKLIDDKKYDQIRFNGNVDLRNVAYKSNEYPEGVNVDQSSITLNNAVIALKDLAGRFLGTSFNANGELRNAIGYALADETLSGKLNVKAGKLDLNKLMGTEPADSSVSEAGTDPFQVPANINFALNASVDEVLYDKVSYRNVTGAVLLKDESAILQNLKTEALGGNIVLNGSYSTKENKKQPDIQFDYSIKNIDVQKAFNAFNTVKKLMPVGQFLSGKLNSDLSVNGKLGGDMMPLLNSLTGKGNLLLLEGVLRNFQPLEKLGSALNLTEFKSLTLKDIKNYIEFANGKVLVKPFTIKVSDIELEVGGMHGFDQSLDYTLNLKVPRNKFGSQGNALVNNLVTQATNKGIPVKVGETVSLNVGMKGTITNPSIQYDLKEAVGDVSEQFKEQAKEFVQSRVDSAKSALKDTAEAIKKEIIQSAKDELLKKIGGQKEADSTATDKSPAKKAEETIKNIKDIFKKKS